MSEETTKSKIGLAVSDPVHSRLLAGAAVHLGLESEELSTPDAQANLRDSDFELIVADLDSATELLSRLRTEHRLDDPYRPAVIAVVPVGSEATQEEGFDGVLPLPQSPSNVSAQLSIALYAHRSFARRYDDAMEELKLHRQVFHSVTNGITVAAATGDLELTYVNPAFEVMTGYTLEESLGKNCRFLQNGDTDQPGLTLIREAIRSGSEVTAILRNYRKDGKEFWNEVQLAPIRRRDGKVTHFVGIQTDVTARVTYENALRESEKLAVVGRLAASIAHEINNPLESVTNLVYLAEHSDEFSECKDYLHQVDEELRRIKLITSQSLRFYRQSTKPQATQLSQLIDSVMNLQRGRVGAAKVSVERRDRLSRSIVCMESEIRQVLNNLINNATDAMKATGGRLLLRTAEARNHASGARGIVVTVADTGGGISAESMKSMYQAFYSTKGSQGTGLGLWISSEIVTRHHGSMKVRSRQASRGGAHGTVFRLFLPFQGVAGDEEEDAKAKDQASA